MARLNVLEYPADFVRGWPHGEAIEMNYPGTVDMGNGDIVAMNASSQFAPLVVVADAAVNPIVVARGQRDTFDGAGSGTGNLYSQVVPNIGILGNYVVRTSVSNSVNPPVAGAPVALAMEDLGDGKGSRAVWSAVAAGVTSAAVVGAYCLESAVSIPDADGNLLANVAVIVVR